MPFNLGDEVFYNYSAAASADQFGNPGAAIVTAVAEDGSCSLVVFPKGCSYVVGHTGVTEGSGPGQASYTAPPPPQKSAQSEADKPAAAKPPAK